MKQLVTKIKSWFKDSNDRKYQEFIERTRAKMENHEVDDYNYETAKYIAETEGITLAEATRRIAVNNQQGKDYIKNLKEDNEISQAEKMRELADKKRNKKPFYKDDKAKDWEQ